MTPSTLIIPIENQVRELDAKLMLACMAAERGFPVIIGSRAYIHYIAGSLPRGIYLAKSMRGLSATMFRLLRLLGHDIAAWEEEALVHPPAETYFTLRLSPKTVDKVSHVFAWGDENCALMKQYPHTPRRLPLHVTGNPRGDMLRPELRSYFESAVAEIGRRYAPFLLINTNYSDVNPFIPDIGLFAKGSDGIVVRGQAGLGMSEAFAVGLREHKQMLFDRFQQMIPHLARRFPHLNVVVRPHPSEKFSSYERFADQFPNVHVDANGNIIPWLLAARVMIHNGCTTGVEAYALGRRSIAYLPGLNPYYDFDFQGLPNRLSDQCHDLDELESTLSRVLEAGEVVRRAPDQEQEKLFSHFIAAQSGSFACERILNVLVAEGYLNKQPPAPMLLRRLSGRGLTAFRARQKQAKHQRDGANRQNYHDHRFPTLAVSDIAARVARLGETLGRFQRIAVEPYSKHVFSVVSR